MNALSRQILRTLEETPLKDMSIHFLKKQCEETGIDVENIKKEDLDPLMERFKRILPFFIGKRTEEVIKKIYDLAERSAEGGK